MALWHIILNVFCLLNLLSSISGFKYGRCFQKLERHSIDNSQPLTEIFRTSSLECLTQCIEHTGNGEEQTEAGLCRSVVYDHLQHMCRLYGHDGQLVPAIVHPANGFDLYRRTASTQECSGPVQRLIALQAKKKGLLAAPNQANQQDPIALPSNAELPLDDKELAELLDQLEKKEQTNEGDQHQSQSDILQQREGDGGTDEGEGSDRRRTDALDCVGQGRPTGFLAFFGSQRQITDERADANEEEYLGWNQQECAQYCAENETPDGQKFVCAGYSYTPGGGRCRLHRRLTEGELSLQSSTGSLYAEKWCIPAHRYGFCRDSTLFNIRLQQRYNQNCVPIAILDGIQTLLDCMQKCMDQSGCKSVSFHAPSSRCLLHREQPLPHLVDSGGEGWTIAENGCSETRGPIGFVDNEEGEIDRARNSADAQGKALGIQNVAIDDCADGLHNGFLSRSKLMRRRK